MDDIQMTVRALTNDPRTDQLIVWLGGVHGKVLLPLIVGGTPAVSIYLDEARLRHTRPLTHDLIASCLDQFDTRVQEVRFNDLVGEVLNAELVLHSPTEHFTLRARPSDAIALALKHDAPIYMSVAVLADLGFDVSSIGVEARRTNSLDGPQQTRGHRGGDSDGQSRAS